MSITGNAVAENNGLIYKRFTHAHDLWTATMQVFHNLKYSKCNDRFRRELERLERYKALNVPQLVRYDEHNQIIVTRKITGRLVSELLIYDSDVNFDKQLTIVEGCAHLLRQIHEIGVHGDPVPKNFILSNDGIYTFDFEEEPKHAKETDLTNLYLYFLIFLGTHQKHAVARAIRRGYGNEPREEWTPWTRLVYAQRIRYMRTHQGVK